MNIFDIFDYSKMKASPKLCLVLFALGGAVGIVLDMLGIGSFTPEPVCGFLSLPVPDFIVLPALYLFAAILTGALSKRPFDSVIYGAALGQCQFLLPFILEVVFIHSGETFGVFWRMLCGLPMTFLAAGAAYSVKALIIKASPKKKR